MRVNLIRHGQSEQRRWQKAVVILNLVSLLLLLGTRQRTGTQNRSQIGNYVTSLIMKAKPDAQCFARFGPNNVSLPAIGGIDLVAFYSINEGEAPVKGIWQHACTYAKYKFLFATEENRRLFSANPQIYLPAYDGFCAWSVSEEYWKPIGDWPVSNYTDKDAWTIAENRLFLFFNKQARAFFLHAFKYSTHDDLLSAAGKSYRNLAVDLHGRISKGDTSWSYYLDHNMQGKDLIVTNGEGCACDGSDC